jgi:hypothetical protein
MDPRLKAILQKAKAIDERARQFDKTDMAILESNVTSRQASLSEEINEPVRNSAPKVAVGSDMYKQRVKESKLPPEIQRAMLENPIPQPDAVGTFSLDDEDIKEINPKYGSIKEEYYSDEDEFDYMEQKRHIVEQKKPVAKNSSTLNENVIRQMIAEEISKALPNIVEKYFDKKMIQENVKILKTLNSKVKRVQ